MVEKPWNFIAEKPVDAPGCYMFMGTDSQSPEGIVLCKEDGTWWEVDEQGIGDQIVNKKSLKTFRGWYAQVLQSEKRHLN
jgi:hypothetical protein